MNFLKTQNFLNFYKFSTSISKICDLENFKSQKLKISKIDDVSGKYNQQGFTL